MKPWSEYFFIQIYSEGIVNKNTRKVKHLWYMTSWAPHPFYHGVSRYENVIIFTQAGFHRVCLTLCVCVFVPLPMRFFRPLIGPQIT